MKLMYLCSLWIFGIFCMFVFCMWALEEWTHRIDMLKTNMVQLEDLSNPTSSAMTNSNSYNYSLLWIFEFLFEYCFISSKYLDWDRVMTTGFYLKMDKFMMPIFSVEIFAFNTVKSCEIERKSIQNPDAFRFHIVIILL